MSKHTPGPWTVYDDSNDGKTNRIEIAAIGKTVARIYHSVPEEDLPNARLIAAAPELLEALTGCVRIIRNMGTGVTTIERQEADPESALNEARAVIAKATGV